MTDFLDVAPSLEDYWRGIILFGKNVACYKFALAQSLLELAPKEKSIVTLEELAEPYSRYIIEHLRHCDTQSQKSSKPYPFLEACRQFLRDEITEDELISITARKGLNVVLDKFHNLNRREIPFQFYSFEGRGMKALSLTDEIYQLLQSNQAVNFSYELEARWRLVETAWELQLPQHLVAINYELETQLLFTETSFRRVNVTSCRDALNGYQKGHCFYCFDDIQIESKSNDLADVDHFFPHSLKKYAVISLIDGVWNLVLACQTCNSSKSNQLPDFQLLERLSNRNEFFINSHHPLRETLINQTGASYEERVRFLNQNYREAQKILINSQWKTILRKNPSF